MRVTQDAQKEILKSLQKKIENDEDWADAFAKLAELPDCDQATIVYWMLEDIKLQNLWDETLERTADIFLELMDKAREADGGLTEILDPDKL